MNEDLRQKKAAAGRKGQASLLARYGEKARNGWLASGGTVTKQKYGTEYYREIGRKGAAKRWGSDQSRP